jgi:hypothetical protein
MSQATEHDVTHGVVDLILHGLVEHGIAISVHGRPPTRHAIDEIPTVA